ncbi:RHS repeat-associated core domain-containing protein [Leucobacter komagatae]|uniref:RHS repeat-associated core domain-containing protein n=1 Tax=Leucobacter komagatae TaxID=55969 RepID=UPI0011546B70|nr:RHS repeat-associated core domain-containing protein [Leucobacter komagatae]
MSYSPANETVLTRDEAGRVLANTSPSGHQTKWSYDAAGNVTRREDADGAVWGFEYGAGATLLAQTDPLGARTEYEYGAHGALTKQRDPLGRVVEQRLDTFGNLAAVVLPDGAEWLLHHDGLSRLREVIDPDGGVWQRDYDANGALTRVADPTGVTLRTARDRQARTETAASAFTSTTIELDEFGRPVRTTRQDGGSAVTVYDLCGRVVEEVDAEGGLTRYERDPSGRVVRVISAAGRETRFEYDACGRPAVMIDGAGGRTELRYDADSRVVEQWLPNGDVARAKHDSVGRIVAEHVPGRGVARYRYDLAGRIVAAQDTRYGQRTFEYDPAGQLITATNGLGGKTRYDYDEQGRIVAITDPVGGVVRRTYTSLNRVDSVTDGLGRTTVGTYDAAGRQLTQTDPDGRRLAWKYDAEGLVCSVSTGERALSETAVDHRTGALTVTDFTGPGASPVTHRVKRDRLGRVVLRARGDEVTRWEYDADGDRRTLFTATGDEARYSYDEVGRLVRVEHSAFGVISYSYDPAGNLLSVVAGDRAQTWAYRDGFAVEHTLTDADGVTTTRIKRDPEGRIIEVADGDGATAYEYDAAEQLARAVSETDRAWEYDAAGRLVREHADAQTTEYEYDLAGQLTKRTAVDGRQTRYEYDGAGRRTRDDGPDSSSVFAWDERGWLTSIKRAGEEHRLWVDALGELAEVDGDRVTWDSAARTPSVTGLGARRVFASAGGFTGLEDELASLGWRPARATQTDDPWATVGLSPGDGALGLTANGVPTVAGLEWMGARAYDPGSRGFLSVDPLQPVAGAGWAGNPYSYAGNDPLRELDPFGLSPVTDAELQAWDRMRLAPLSLVFASLAAVQNGYLDAVLRAHPYARGLSHTWGEFSRGDWAREPVWQWIGNGLNVISTLTGIATLVVLPTPAVGAAPLLGLVSFVAGVGSAVIEVAADPTSPSSWAGGALALLGAFPLIKVVKVAEPIAISLAIGNFHWGMVTSIVKTGELLQADTGGEEER